ncbi:hypothetical protein [Brevibacterium gallinarum]|uniref:Uncharacterized protein n=1 Tax=Brevibacterium gallinarum TaxID=2762220 RepID=A0ABR8WUI1_9MICO|nr:hypothetical protein [Brevibacterium gallinarum]MBD8020548.1 hypothetical protein [Brevibacterium gallinarum]
MLLKEADMAVQSLAHPNGTLRQRLDEIDTAVSMVVVYDIVREAGSSLAGYCSRRSLWHTDDEREKDYWSTRARLVRSQIRRLDPNDLLGLIVQGDAWVDELAELDRQYPA